MQHAKLYMLPAEIKLHPDEIFYSKLKLNPPCFSGQIKRAKVSTQLYRAMLWWPRIDVHKKGQACRKRGGWGGFSLAQFLADQLTLSQPGGGAHYAHQITMCPPPGILDLAMALHLPKRIIKLS